MAVVSTGLDFGVHRRVLIGLGRLGYAIGWLVVKILRAVATVIGAVLVAVGWFAAAVVWRSLCWCARAVRLGWQEGHKPFGADKT